MFSIFSTCFWQHFNLQQLGKQWEVEEVQVPKKCQKTKIQSKKLSGAGAGAGAGAGGAGAVPKRGRGRRHSIQVIISIFINVIIGITIDTIIIVICIVNQLSWASYSFQNIISTKWVVGRGESILEERALWKFSNQLELASSNQQLSSSSRNHLGSSLEVVLVRTTST